MVCRPARLRRHWLRLTAGATRSPAEQRGGYALTLAQFYAATGVSAAENGRDAANTATALTRSAPQAWAVLAAARLSCGDASGTRRRQPGTAT
ncbi:MAG: hypothetical protein U0074_01040 [Kouleothrix sp.]